MKTTPFLLAVAITFGAACGVLASDKKEARQTNPKPAEKATQVQTHNKALTGSYIKRDVKRAGIIVTDNPRPVYLLDQHTIQLSGAADLSQVLIRTGFRR